MNINTLIYQVLRSNFFILQHFYSMHALFLQQLLFSYSVLPLSMVRHTSWFILASVLLWDLYRYSSHLLTIAFMWIHISSQEARI
jgi:hypothetical protein